MTFALFALWLIGAAKTVIDDYELTYRLGFTDWFMLFGVAAAWPVVDAVFVFSTLRKKRGK